MSQASGVRSERVWLITGATSGFGLAQWEPLGRDTAIDT
jgi:NADP-dependent 3-hydroxy acid dehydrogenase YdfG